MFCTRCGKPVRDGLKFCTSCGAPVTSDNKGSEGVKAHEDDPLPPAGERLSPRILPAASVSDGKHREKPRKKSIWGKVALIVLLLLALAVGGLWIVVGSGMIGDGLGIEISFSSGDQAKGSKAEEPDESKKTDVAQASSAQTSAPPTTSTEVATTAPANGEYIFQDSDVRVLDRRELEGFSAEQCRLARNEIYARHGRLFDDEALQRYFQSRSWYRGTIPASAFSESMLSEVEKINADLILSYEREMGYRQ